MSLSGQQGIPSSHHQQNAGLVASLQAILYHAQGEHQPPKILKVERDWMVQDTDLERSWENIAKNKIAPHNMGRLEGYR
ncbi:hypothetical protein Taro_056127 [Colocasia esculenta]|uniref:Uncharacterized protein n=1 Tax=Colocasia esculenta TaxID=4460 RepID=A0A843XUW3_COLES|nr:hypothetical protein [Colocasia esculenta]